MSLASQQYVCNLACVNDISGKGKLFWRKSEVFHFWWNIFVSRIIWIIQNKNVYMGWLLISKEYEEYSFHAEWGLTNTKLVFVKKSHKISTMLPKSLRNIATKGLGCFVFHLRCRTIAGIYFFKRFFCVSSYAKRKAGWSKTWNILRAFS